ncbi:thioredoxin family protein [Desertivirga arenae]|uniref:thioredoxin family protein n=1 Tax=Desertivirga arenae TaxID=2810309 RepID=UPI001A960F85|nr:thioredoxin family protein [Pedobacter sp. SYSU D00823]
MTKLLSLILLFFVTSGFSQEITGIQFAHNQNWEEIKAKAKAEKKYIFIDAFTTWCGPCKQMAKEVFPLKEVGEFYNLNFINVKVQMDSTKTDSEETRRWYSAARKIGNDYQINAYPTYIFLNSDGVLVHRAVGSSPASEFIAKGKDALNSDRQYYGLKRQYEAGKKDPDFLYKLINAARQAYDSGFIPVVAKDYFSTQPDLTKPEVIKLLPFATSSSTDAGFTFFLNNSNAADSVLGKGASEGIVKSIILKENVYPKLRTSPPQQNGAMMVFAGEVKKDVDWDIIEKDLNSTYPQYTTELLLTAKKTYYNWTDQSAKFCEVFNEYFLKYPEKVSKYELNNVAWKIFQKNSDQKSLNYALAWSKKTLEGSSAREVMFMDTYANLLYKIGKKQEAIALEAEAVRLSGEKNENGELHKVLNKMKKGERTWDN